MKIGEFVYIRQGNTFSYGRIIQVSDSEGNPTKFSVECIDDLYYDLTVENIYESRQEFLEDTIYYLTGAKQ